MSGSLGKYVVFVRASGFQRVSELSPSNHLFHRTLPIHLQNRFTGYSTTRCNRRINTLVMVQARTNIKAMCLSVYGVKLWNYLSTNLRDCNSVIIFKKNLKKYLISIY